MTVTDTLGRPALSISGVVGSPTTVAVAGVGQNYIVNWGTANYNLNPGAQMVGSPNPNGGCAMGNAIGSQPAIQTITLPDGQSYTFTYDPTYGLLTGITYPTGATVSYVWETNPQSAIMLAPDSSGHADGCLYRYGKPALQSRTVSIDGTHPALVQSFSYNPQTQWDPNNPAN